MRGKHPLPPGTGFTFIELVLVLAIGLTLLGIAVPRVAATSDRVALASARSAVTSAAAVARAAALRYGRTSYLVLDVAADRLSVRSDTSLAGDLPPVTLMTRGLWSELGVDLGASALVVCFDPRGVTPFTPGCPGAAVLVRFARGTSRDSLSVSTTGLVVR